VSEVRSTWGRYASAFATEGTAAEDRDSIRRLIELADLKPGSIVLDVATGAGYTAFAFARAGCRVIPSDPTHEMLLATRGGWLKRGFDGEARCVEAWAEALPFAEGSIDAVISHRAPHQFADADAFAREARRVLKPDGTLGIADQSPPDGYETWHNDFERMRDPTHEHARSPSEWHGVFTRAGLTVRAVDVVYQQHDVEEWLERVDCPPDRRAVALKMLDEIPDEIRDVYRPEMLDGRLRMRTPQCVVVATI
jgi:ubiquinone/menaquinone biosynthesis C-methylase UbiE